MGRRKPTRSRDFRDSREPPRVLRRNPRTHRRSFCQPKRLSVVRNGERSKSTWERSRRDGNEYDHHERRNENLLQRLGIWTNRRVLAWMATECGRVGRADAVSRAKRLSRHCPRPPRPRPFQPAVEWQRDGYLRG